MPTQCPPAPRAPSRCAGGEGAARLTFWAHCQTRVALLDTTQMLVPFAVPRLWVCNLAVHAGGSGREEALTAARGPHPCRQHPFAPQLCMRRGSTPLWPPKSCCAPQQCGEASFWPRSTRSPFPGTGTCSI